MSKIKKTNVMRILDKNKIQYNSYQYDEEITNGETVAKLLNQDVNQVFKTLVTVSNNNEYFVFVVPVAGNLNLKKAAKSVNAKKIEMLKQKYLFSLTGYVHGGCSPIGMKKQFITVVDSSSLNFDTIIFSAGKLGNQVEITAKDLEKLIDCKFFDII